MYSIRNVSRLFCWACSVYLRVLSLQYYYYLSFIFDIIIIIIIHRQNLAYRFVEQLQLILMCCVVFGDYCLFLFVRLFKIKYISLFMIQQHKKITCIYINLCMQNVYVYRYFVLDYIFQCSCVQHTICFNVIF